MFIDWQGSLTRTAKQNEDPFVFIINRQNRIINAMYMQRKVLQARDRETAYKNCMISYLWFI